MDRKEKLRWIRNVLPMLYYIALALICGYAGLRTRSWANLLLPFETGWIVTALFVGYYILNMMVVRKNLVARTRVMTYIAGSSTFVVIYLSMAILVSDVIRLIAKPFGADDEKLFVILGFGCLIFTAAATVWGGMKTHKITVVKDVIRNPKWKKKDRIVLLTDLHIGFFVSVRHIRKMVEQVNRLNADMIVISGDIINAGNTHECPELDEVADLLAEMKSARGTYAVVGNHDPDAQEPEFRKFLKRASIQILEDEVYADENFDLVGRTTRTKQRLPLSELMKSASGDRPAIVLDHDPIGIRDAVREKAALILCGHTHKGQVFPLNLFVRFLYSKDELYGMSKSGETAAVVSAGAGYFSMPMRLGSDCEVVCVDLEP